MNAISQRYSLATGLILLGSAAGLGISLYYYLTPLTGVNGTIGAALVIFSTGIMLLAALIHPMLPKGAFRFTVKALIVADILCTIAAGYFLHEWWLIAAMVVALIGAIWGVADKSQSSTHGAKGAVA
ncbi:hypothetical protein SAMN04515647_1546 [Cohaesibacter sp. ES.047]|uniref:hypothetical protein n=1 Tax=Cohaesibacter sp. ES.047 TaxID=1798205 RepID=UPI000BB6D824|nr:hypothetical protein [Cohaesibacter sp. ES.047]SNY91329.1 hypothetical protein SAMN04515647_1546 [Cohaesibacter sp. ES.047]